MQQIVDVPDRLETREGYPLREPLLKCDDRSFEILERFEVIRGGAL